MNDNTYNGWTNKQTWNINIRFDEIFRDLAENQTFEDVDHLADAFESLVDELEFQGLRNNSLAQDAVGLYLDLVNWKELAEHVAEDLDLFQEEEVE